MAPLRALVDPVATLKEVVIAAAGSDVEAVVLFGSIARGEVSAASVIDLAVIAPNVGTVVWRWRTPYARAWSPP